MAAQLKDGGRYPSVQKLEKAEFARFVTTCQNAPKPSQSLQRLLEASLARKAACRSI